MSLTLKTGQVKVNVDGTLQQLDVVSADTATEIAAIKTATDSIVSKAQAAQTTAANAVSASQSAADKIESQKDTMIASIASVAGQGTDTTLTQSGVAADAKVVGDEVSEIKEDLAQIVKTINVPTSELVSGSFVNYQSGNFSTYSGYSRTDKISIDGCIYGNTIRCNPYLASSAGMAFYDADGVYIIGYNDASYIGSSTEYQNFPIPADAKYIALSFYTKSLPTEINIIFAYEKYVIDEVESLNDDVSVLKERTEDLTDSITYTDHYFIRPNGTLANITGAHYYYNEAPITILYGEKITVYAKGGVTGNVSMLSRWNADGSEWIENLHTCEDGSNFETIEYTATHPIEYLRTSFYQTKAKISVLKHSYSDEILNISEQIDNVSDSVSANASSISELAESFAPYKNVKTNVLAMYKKIVCCGDSLTYGAVFISDSQSVQAINPYPKVLAMLSGQTVDFHAVGGYTAQNWWEAFADNIQGENNLYIVYLGTNAGLTDTVDTDCAGDDYTTFATTQTGYYGRILQKIADTNSKCVLVKVYASSGDVVITNTAIDAFAEKYNTLALPAIKLADTIYHYWRGSTAGTNGVHLNDLGYVRFATLLYDKFCTMSATDAYKIAPTYYT